MKHRNRVYLGDAVYAQLDGDAELVTLTVEYGSGPEHTIHMDPWVLGEFMRYAQSILRAGGIAAAAAALVSGCGAPGVRGPAVVFGSHVEADVVREAGYDVMLVDTTSMTCQQVQAAYAVPAGTRLVWFACGLNQVANLDPDGNYAGAPVFDPYSAVVAAAADAAAKGYVLIVPEMADPEAGYGHVFTRPFNQWLRGDRVPDGVGVVPANVRVLHLEIWEHGGAAGFLEAL